METKDNIIYFESDDEFTDFCVAPYAQIITDEGVPYIAGDYSDLYKQYLQEGKTFIIKDEDSVVFKRRCVSKRVPVMMNGSPLSRTTLVQLDVENLEEYFDWG